MFINRARTSKYLFGRCLCYLFIYYYVCMCSIQPDVVMYSNSLASDGDDD